MKLVLLPGLDGTGKLFEPLIKALPSSLDIQVITYSLNKEQSYHELIKYVKLNLPQEEFILLGESFSGSIAYHIALSQPKYLKALILVATFLENPRPFLLKFIPSTKILALPIPKILSKIFLLGFTVQDETIKLFNQSIKMVSPIVIKYRLKEITKLQITHQEIGLKTIYIQASNDKLVPSKALKDWQKTCKNINVFQINSEHFILQTNPIKSAKIIMKTVYDIESSLY